MGIKILTAIVKQKNKMWVWQTELPLWNFKNYFLLLSKLQDVCSYDFTDSIKWITINLWLQWIAAWVKICEPLIPTMFILVGLLSHFNHFLPWLLEGRYQEDSQISYFLWMFLPPGSPSPVSLHAEHNFPKFLE